MKITYKKAPRSPVPGVPANPTMPVRTAAVKRLPATPVEVDPWKVNTLVDGAQAKIVKRKDGKYMLGIILADRSALEVDLDTTDRSNAAMLATECIRLYNDSEEAEGKKGGDFANAGREFREMLYRLIRESEESQE